MPNDQPQRYKSVRLPYYHYCEPGAYFLTLVSAARECLFGRIEDGEIVVTAAGQIVIREWLRSPLLRPQLTLDVFVLMPNHFHGIVFITELDRAHGSAALRLPALPRRAGERTPASISSFLAGFKATTTKQINILRGQPGQPVWQPKFYDHVIRSEQDLARIREYIVDNPSQWELDRENPDCKPANRSNP
jgi:putative transposase